MTSAKDFFMDSELRRNKMISVQKEEKRKKSKAINSHNL